MEDKSKGGGRGKEGEVRRIGLEGGRGEDKERKRGGEEERWSVGEEGRS